ncbi:hypothetical protein NKG05_12035 [Oerskovia sp. M15]
MQLVIVTVAVAVARAFLIAPATVFAPERVRAETAELADAPPARARSRRGTRRPGGHGRRGAACGRRCPRGASPARSSSVWCSWRLALRRVGGYLALDRDGRRLRGARGDRRDGLRHVRRRHDRVPLRRDGPHRPVRACHGAARVGGVGAARPSAVRARPQLWLAWVGIVLWGSVPRSRTRSRSGPRRTTPAGPARVAVVTSFMSFSQLTAPLSWACWSTRSAAVTRC